MKALTLIWAAACISVALVATMQFFVTYAIRSDKPREWAIEDVALMNRVTGNLAPLSYAAAALLVVNAIIIVALVWRRPRI